MLAADQDIINEPITQKSKRSPAALSLWLKRNAPVVKLSTNDTTATIIKTHKKINSFFLRNRLPNLPGESHPNKKDSGKPGPVWTTLHTHQNPALHHHTQLPSLLSVLSASWRQRAASSVD
jgi:hypothetical protein